MTMYLPITLHTLLFSLIQIGTYNFNNEHTVRQLTILLTDWAGPVNLHSNSETCPGLASLE